jgi:hypothetical protein
MLEAAGCERIFHDSPANATAHDRRKAARVEQLARSINDLLHAFERDLKWSGDARAPERASRSPPARKIAAGARRSRVGCGLHASIRVAEPRMRAYGTRIRWPLRRSWPQLPNRNQKYQPADGSDARSLLLRLPQPSLPQFDLGIGSATEVQAGRLPVP